MNATHLQRLAALILPLCALWNILPSTQSAHADQRPSSSAFAIELPREWQGQPLRPLALTEIEQRFARDFPGQMARLTTGHETLVWRHLDRPTRRLHPAADCYRALGWKIRDEQLQQIDEDEGQGERWRCFLAERGEEERLRVCERIEDAAGQSFTDTSAWYWAAALGQSQGPWQALTVAAPL